MSITLPNTNWQDDKSTKEQRQLIDVELRRKLWLSYSDLLKVIAVELDRPIHDIEQLTKGEASRIIDLLKSKIK